MGQTLGDDDGERVTSLVLCCTVPVFGPADAWHERAATVRASGMGSIVEAPQGRWFTDGFRAARPDAGRAVRRDAGRDRPGGVRHLLRGLARFSSTDRLGTIDVPTRVVAGAQDPVCPPDQCR